MEEQMDEVKTNPILLSCQASPQATPHSDPMTYNNNPSRRGHIPTVCEAASVGKGGDGGAETSNDGSADKGGDGDGGAETSNDEGADKDGDGDGGADTSIDGGVGKGGDGDGGAETSNGEGADKGGDGDGGVETSNEEDSDKGGDGDGGAETSNDEDADKVNAGEENFTVGDGDGENDCGVIGAGGGSDTGEEDRSVGHGDEAEDGGSSVCIPSSNTPPGQRSPPDGGWGWVVALGSAVIMMLIPVMGPCFGILFSRYLLESGTSSTTTAWIFNSQCFIWNTSGLFSRPLTKEFGYRKVGVFGAFTASAGFMVSAFAPAPEFLFFSFSVLCGVGGGIVTTMCFSIVPQYFVSHRGAANSLMMAGVGAGQIGGPPFARWLQDTFSDKGATFIIGAIMLHACVAATLFHPVEWHLKEEQEKGQKNKRLLIQEESVQKARQPTTDSGTSHLKLHQAEEQKKLNEVQPHTSRTETHQAIHNKIQSSNPRKKTAVLDILIRVAHSTASDLRVLRSARASIICLAGTLCLNSNLNFIMMVPFAIQDAGESLDFAAWCLSVKAVCNLLTRLLVSPLADWPKFSVRGCYVAGFVILAISTFVFPTIASPPWLLATMAVYGCGIGANLGLHSLMMIEVMGLDQLPSVYGASSFIIALGFICFGPLIGVVRDAWGSYLISMWVLGAMLLVSILLWMFMGPAARYDKRKEQQQQQQQQHQANSLA